MSATMAVKEKKVSFAGKDYVIRKMALGKYADFSEKLEQLLPNKEEIATMIRGEAGDRIEVIMRLFKSAPRTFAELIHIATGVPEKELLEALPEEVMDLAEEVYQLNEIDKLGERVKKVLRMGQAEVK